MVEKADGERVITSILEDGLEGSAPQEGPEGEQPEEGLAEIEARRKGLGPIFRAPRRPKAGDVVVLERDNLGRPTRTAKASSAEAAAHWGPDGWHQTT